MNRPNRKNPLSGLISTLLHPDREEEEMKERMVVVEAANYLQVGEFQFLQLAYRDWFGEDLPEALVARLFSSYMLDNEVPHWARHYARYILDGCARGTIDENAAAFHRYDHDYHTSVPQGVRRFMVAVGCLIFFLGGSIYLAEKAAQHPATQFPPYLDESDLPPAKKQPEGSGEKPLGQGFRSVDGVAGDAAGDERALRRARLWKLLDKVTFGA